MRSFIRNLVIMVFVSLFIKGAGISSEEHKKMKKGDAEGNGRIDFSEFVIAMAKNVNDIDAEKEIKEAFDVFDKDGNGRITVEELRYVSVNLGETFSDEDTAEMLKQADFDGDGVVSYKDFSRMMKLNQRLS